MAITRLTDGGYVDVRFVASTIFSQKYAADGTRLGSEFAERTLNTGNPPVAVALSDGGYALGYTTSDNINVVTRVHTFDGGGVLESTPLTENTGGPFRMASLPDGGFVVSFSSTEGIDNNGAAFPRVTFFQQFDNAGAAVTPPVPLLGSIQPNAPTITVLDGDSYRINWFDGVATHAITVDPNNPPDLTPPAAATLVGYDDAGPKVGEFTGPTNDASPVVRIAVSEPGWFRLEGDPVFGNGFGTRYMINQAVTQADVARGYAEAALPSMVEGAAFNITVRVADARGITSAQSQMSLRVDMTAPLAPTISQVLDDAAPQAGGVARDESTNDATPTVYVSLAGTQAVVGDTVQLTDGGANLGGPVSLIDADLARGYLAITPADLGQGAHSFQARITDAAGNVGAASAAYGIDISPTGDDQPRAGGGDGGLYLASTSSIDTLVGGSGADTLVAGREGDQLTGGVGADLFVISALPYRMARITDFTTGTDRLDVTALMRDSGFTGSDPMAAGLMRLESDGVGGARVLWDGRPYGFNWPFQVAHLEGVSPNGLSYARLTGAATDPADPPPPPPPPEGNPSTGAGQVLTSDQYGDLLVGGSGNDTLMAGQGPDQLTGAGGGDAFVFRDLPWNAGHITDFAIGADRLDLSALFQASGYVGSNPVADRYVVFESDGAGGTKVFYDTDGPSAANSIRFLITTLDNVPTAGLAWNQLSGAGAPPPPPAPPLPPAPPAGEGSTGPGETITATFPNQSLTGGGGDDVLNAGRGTGTFTGGAGADIFAFAQEPWAPGHITDFVPGTDRIDFRALFDTAGYTGTDPFADGYLTLFDDGAGGTKVLFDRDAGGTVQEWPNYVLAVDHVAPGALGLTNWIVQ